MRKLICTVAAVCLFAAFDAGVAQKKPAAPDETRKLLAQKAHALEMRGRPDMAIQAWRQILLSEPNNTDALAGLAKDYKLTGNGGESNLALDRLRNLNPHDPNIASIEAMNTTAAQSSELRQAGELAQQGKSAEAMRVYRQLYGDHPPDGEIALAYYENLYSTPGGREAAIAALRALAARNPGDGRYSVKLGILLTYDAKTREEGIHILQAHAQDASAQAALRQALLWNAANPASAGELRQYLKNHPQDTELAGHLKENEALLGRMNAGIAHTEAERAAFAALNGKKLEEAERRFAAILVAEPENPRAEAGMGFLRMRQNEFSGAIDYLSKAEENGLKSRAVEDALATSRFWFTLDEATEAAEQQSFEQASAKFREALVMRPHSPEALNGLAGLLVRERQYSAAAGVYELLVKLQPATAKSGLRSDWIEAWRGLFLAYARDGQNQKAETVLARFPTAVKAAEAKDLEFLRAQAELYHAENRTADAERVLAQALALPAPKDDATVKTETRLEYAGILMEAHRDEQAARVYARILEEEAGNRSAWMGLVDAHHELAQDAKAIADVERMPPAAYEEVLSDPGFLALLGAIYAQAQQPEIAQSFLERAEKIEIAAGGRPDQALELQLASIYQERGNTAQAFEIYRRTLTEHPESATAWKGLIAGFAAANHPAEALEEIALIPQPVRRQLEAEIDFVEIEAGLYAVTGETARALALMNRIESYYAQQKTALPANIAVQDAWLLYNTGNDRALYPALMRLGGRDDLTVAQRGKVEEIWANWSVRRAATAFENGNAQRATAILETAMQAFAENLAVRKLLAGGYLKIGEARQALAIYKSMSFEAANASDYQGAVGAALAVNDKTQAEAWLRQALSRYPTDAAILSLAARFEQARGDNQLAAGYWRASLAAMPQPSLANKLAHELAYPDASSKPSRVRTPADLERLLNPDEEPFASTAKLPPLPSYGPDPYNGSVPLFTPAPQPAAPEVHAPAVPIAQISPQALHSTAGLRLSAHPINDATAEAQRRDADESGGQFVSNPTSPARNSYQMAQYTPSAQEAAQAAANAPTAAPEKKSKKNTPAQSVPILPPATQPAAESAPAEMPSTVELPTAQPEPTAAPISDEQLQEHNLPPLRGPWYRVQREERAPSPRDEAEMQLRSIESGYSGWLGGTGLVNYRSGSLGYDHLSALDAPLEASAPLGAGARFTIVAKPVFLDSGQADGTSVIQLSTLGQKNIGAVPQPIGTLMTTDTTPPPQQNAAGIGGEMQLVFPHFALAGGYSPSGFLVASFTGRMQWKPENGPFTFNFSRDPVRDTELSYAGLRDPGSTSLSYSGNVWGGVVANQGSVQFTRGDAESGLYFSVGGQYLSGYKVETNTRIDGSGGAYWRVRTIPEYGDLSIGANFFAMHYAHNEGAFTYGMGGYFSPQVYFLANVPFTWNGHTGTRWHYNILGSLGVQAFQEDLTALFPAFTNLENIESITVGTSTYNELALPAKTSVGPNYDLRGQAAYAIGPHWFVGGFLNANNSRDYSSVSVGFSIRYLFREQPSTVAGPTGLFPSDGMRPFAVP